MFLSLVIFLTLFHDYYPLILLFAGAYVSFNKSDDLMESGGRLVLKGYGSISSVRKFRDEVRQLLNESRFLSLGRLRSRSSAYFMQNASCIFVQRQMRKDIHLMLIRYFGPSQVIHTAKDRKVPVPCLLSGTATNESSELADASPWREYFVAEMQNKIMAQLSPMMNHNDMKLFNSSVTSSEHILVDTLSFQAKFGVFYIIGAESSLESTNGKIPLFHLEEAINRCNNRKRFVRSELSTKDKEDYKPIKMVNLSKSTDASNEISQALVKSTRSTNMKTSKNENRKKKIGSSFYPGAVNIYQYQDRINGEKWNQQEDLLISSGSVSKALPSIPRFDQASTTNDITALFSNHFDQLVSVLMSCGFEPYESSSDQRYKYKVTFPCHHRTLCMSFWMIN